MKSIKILLHLVLVVFFSNIALSYGQTLYLYPTNNKELSINKIINYKKYTKLNSKIVNLGLGKKN